ncbi:MAG: polyketide synthase family protein [Mycobacterium sp.]|nr:polyketide synthase family protein [Mycobacterium sp.]
MADHDIAGRTRQDTLARLSTPLSNTLMWELDGAQLSLDLGADEILLAALGRTVARTIGDGVVAVDVAGDGRPVLRPDSDLPSRVGGFTTIYPVSLTCATVQQASATETLGAVHRTLAAVRDAGHGVLQYFHAPTALQLAAHAPSDILFNYVGMVPQSMPVRETLPSLGHALELRVYRSAGVLHLDWWYDSCRFDHSTVEELTEQFPLALIELTSEAVPPI